MCPKDGPLLPILEYSELEESREVFSPGWYDFKIVRIFESKRYPPCPCIELEVISQSGKTIPIYVTFKIFMDAAGDMAIVNREASTLATLGECVGVDVRKDNGKGMIGKEAQVFLLERQGENESGPYHFNVPKQNGFRKKR